MSGSASALPAALSSADPAPFAALVVGAILEFDLTTASETAPVEVAVEHVYHPFTMSAVLRVRTLSARDPALPPEMILKLYDRRCMNNMRADMDPPEPWSPDKDAEYAEWLRGVADGSVPPTDFDDDELWEREQVTGGRLEGFLQHEAMKMYKREDAAYAVLAELQGELIPRLYGTVAYRVPGDTSPVPGVLIEYVPGPTLRELVATWATRTPRPPDAELARVCEAAVSLVERIAPRYDVINLDVRIDNFIYRKGGLSPVVLIDLAQCERRGAESDAEWREWKVNLNEVGALGQVLAQKVEDQVGPGIWHYDVGRMLKPDSW